MRQEILAPAGNYQSFLQAVNNGADAVYLAGKAFGARASAENFTNEQIFALIAEAHLLGVKVYVTVNTLIKDCEFNDAVNFIEELYIHNVDAIIVQDLGLMDYIIRKFPDLDVHASTQVNVHSVEQAQFLKRLGVKRIILARETPINIIKAIKKQVDIEVEVFVHGALCMSYSGNCYLSSIIGGRSGNRGRCAQPCRLKYTLLDDETYWLSPKDLMTIDYLDTLTEIGIDSFKIEGRLRRPEYVGLAVKAYRDALDNGNTNYHKDLQLMFNREFTKGYMFGEENSNFTNIDTSNHIGICIGRIVSSKFPYAFIALDDEVAIGDSIRITGPVNDAVTINEMYVDGKFREIAHQNEIIKIRVHKDLHKHSLVLKTTDAKLLSAINATPSKKIALTGRLEVIDNFLELTISDGRNNVTTRSAVAVMEARNHDFNQRILMQINKTNDTIYYFKELTPPPQPVFLPIKVINEMRREALAAIDQCRIKRPKRRINEVVFEKTNIKQEKRLFVKVENDAHLQAALDIGIKDIISERDLKLEGVNFYHIAPRILAKNSGYNASNNIGILGNNCLLTGVYLNVFNAYTVNLLHRLGVKTVGLSIELSFAEMQNLITTYRNLFNSEPNLLVMVYGHYQLMIMKHCLINKAYKEKHLYCNKCISQKHFLIDRKQVNYPLIRDGSCNLVLLNQACVHLINELTKLSEIGISNYLLDFTIETEISDILTSYLKAFNNEVFKLELTNTTLGHFKEGIL